MRETVAREGSETLMTRLLLASLGATVVAFAAAVWALTRGLDDPDVWLSR